MKKINLIEQKYKISDFFNHENKQQYCFHSSSVTSFLFLSGISIYRTTFLSENMISLVKSLGFFTG